MRLLIRARGALAVALVAVAGRLVQQSGRRADIQAKPVKKHVSRLASRAVVLGFIEARSAKSDTAKRGHNAEGSRDKAYRVVDEG